MASEKDTADILAAPAKRRRIQRSCDACRQKRRACDGLRSSTNKCTPCVDNKTECIYSGAPTTTKRQSSSQVLEQKLAHTEKLLRKAKRESSSEASENSQSSANTPGPEVLAMIRSLNARESQAKIEEACLADDLFRMKLGSEEPRFFGKSSGAALVKTTVDLKAASGYVSPGSSPRPLFFEYWKPKAPHTHKPHYIFPSPDLLATLVDLYFEHTNIYQPLLHRPTFSSALADNLHLRDDKFGANVLLVCAVASRFSDDPRVFDAGAPLDCGWNYYAQLPPMLENLFETPSLLDLQRFCLAIQFLEGASTPATWTLVGMGIRMAQDAGAHRRQPSGYHTVEAELWRRAFWILVAYDRIISSRLGRACAMQYHDFDVALPTECDDEYWEHEDPACAFRQPPGKPSRVAYFNAFLRLNNVLAFSLYLLYALQLRIWGDSEWEEVVVAELNSVLTNWVDTIPEHLRWDPNRKDPLWFKQSVALYCSYYYVQMTTHRPLIATVRETPHSMHSLPSLGICTNAARSCSHVADVWYRRMGCTPAIILLPALTTAGIVLLLNMWSAKRTGVPPQMNTGIAEVQKCVQAMRACESRWPMAGFYRDLLTELGNVGQVPLPPTQRDTETETKTHTIDSDTAPPHRNTHTHKRARSDSSGASGLGYLAASADQRRVAAALHGSTAASQNHIAASQHHTAAPPHAVAASVLNIAAHCRGPGFTLPRDTAYKNQPWLVAITRNLRTQH
ncbi:fungal-specific transcription factor domain-containing protein [Mycena vitilis]|nr:fungal-specific transcription factor domain-containing protein [Mycena vitilis]